MKKKLLEFFKYGIYGGITTVINITLFVILKECGMHYIFANSLSYFIVACINYILNKKFVFEKKQQSLKMAAIEFTKFMFVRLVALGVDNIFFYMLVEVSKLNVYFIRISLSFVVILATFFLNKFFVFGKGKNGRTKDEKESIRKS